MKLNFVFFDKKKNGYLKLWTIQTIPFYKNLIINGKIKIRKKHTDPLFSQAYKWMIKEMNKRLGTHYINIYPIWAWYQYESYRKKEPPLTETALLPRGSIGVKLTVIKKANEVLLSDFTLWHFVLNEWFLRNNRIYEKKLNEKIDKLYKEKDFRDFPNKYKRIMQKSWKRIFDLDWQMKDYKISWRDKRIQATFWELKYDEVIEVEFFKAR